eukprot:TRINITY_DN751_c0_g1_i2.p1 TRINITY_DN751_c0_g1~~TRINITY_DN751_c0_g1_i2.p1  ORF type:complete len:193 (-),score=55.34 TRINITY_DN751_c0_g1_i2:68-646(-)
MYPQEVRDLSGWEIKYISCGFQSLGVLADDKTIAWGNGNLGQLGFGMAQKSSAMAKIIEALDDIKTVSIHCGYSATFFRATRFPEDTTDPAEIASNKKLSELPIYPLEGDERGTEKEEEEAKSGEEEVGECGVCKKTTTDDCGVVLICDGCDGEFHMACIKPEITEVPEGDWFCEECGKTDKPAKKKRKLEQ